MRWGEKGEFAACFGDELVRVHLVRSGTSWAAWAQQEDFRSNLLE